MEKNLEQRYREAYEARKRKKQKQRQETYGVLIFGFCLGCIFLLAIS